MGERTPYCDPNARAALVGLAASHTRADIIRAILEGVAFSLKDSFTIFREMNLPVQRVRLGGGGARSALWRQINADAQNRFVLEQSYRAYRRIYPALSGILPATTVEANIHPAS